jgi:hypothetical protein
MPRRSRISVRAAAFHEAGHAVARLHVGAPATAVQIIPHGMTHGSRRWAGRGERRMLNWLLVLFAGSYAQAFETRRSLARTVLHSGKLDMQAAAPAVAWLVRHGYARTRMEALRRVHAETVLFLMLRWVAIERVAAGLLKDGKLTARQVRALARIESSFTQCSADSQL